jgi:exodeoxyribonuclease VII large subunit
MRQLQRRVGRTLMSALESRMQHVDYLSKRLVHPGERLRNQMQHLTHLANRLCGAWKRYAEGQEWLLRGAARGLAAACPDLRRIERERLELARRLRDAAGARVAANTTRLQAIESHLRHLNPEHVLERGYSIALDASGAVVRDAEALHPQDEVTIKFARGSAVTRVEQVKGPASRDDV